MITLHWHQLPKNTIPDVMVCRTGGSTMPMYIYEYVSGREGEEGVDVELVDILTFLLLVM